MSILLALRPALVSPVSLLARVRSILGRILIRIDAHLVESGRVGIPHHHTRTPTGVCPYDRQSGEPCPECEANRDEADQW